MDSSGSCFLLPEDLTQTSQSGIFLNIQANSLFAERGSRDEYLIVNHEMMKKEEHQNLSLILKLGEGKEMGVEEDSREEASG